MKYIYLLLLILILYYLFKNIYQKYSNQENFDPSLVPVSSIVTLAKVAQKLVDGGGTLTNPGNLQIGLPSAGALGNLYVTGTNTVDGNTAIKGTTSIDSLLTANGGISTTTIAATNNIAANSLSTTNGNVSINNGTINLTSDGSGGLYFLNSGNTASPVYNRLYMGPTNVTGDFNASGNAIIGGNSSIGGSLDVNGQLNANGNVVIRNSNLTAPNDLNILLPGGQLNVNNAWGGSGNMNVSGNLNVGKNSTIIGDVIVNGTIRSLKGVSKYLINQSSGQFLSYNGTSLISVSVPDNNSLWLIMPTGTNNAVLMATNGTVVVAYGQNNNGDGSAKLENNTGQTVYVQSWNPFKFGQSGCYSVRCNNGVFSQWANCWGNNTGGDATWTLL